MLLFLLVFYRNRFRSIEGETNANVINQSKRRKKLHSSDVWNRTKFNKNQINPILGGRQIFIELENCLIVLGVPVIIILAEFFAGPWKGRMA